MLESSLFNVITPIQNIFFLISNLTLLDNSRIFIHINNRLPQSTARYRVNGALRILDVALTSLPIPVNIKQEDLYKLRKLKARVRMLGRNIQVLKNSD